MANSIWLSVIACPISKIGQLNLIYLNQDLPATTVLLRIAALYWGLGIRYRGMGIGCWGLGIKISLFLAPSP